MRNIAMSGNDSQRFQRVECVGIVERVEKRIAIDRSKMVKLYQTKAWLIRRVFDGLSNAKTSYAY